MKRKLTPKQKQFADAYIESGNATKSAIEAGYSEKYAHTNANKLLQNTTLKSYIDERMKQIESDKIMSAKEALELISRIARGEEKETKVVATQFDVEEVEVEADLKTKMSAAKEIIKRFPKEDESLKSQLRKANAEADIAEWKAKQLTGEIDGSNETVIVNDWEDKDD